MIHSSKLTAGWISLHKSPDTWEDRTDFAAKTWLNISAQLTQRSSQLIITNAVTDSAEDKALQRNSQQLRHKSSQWSTLNNVFLGDLFFLSNTTKRFDHAYSLKTLKDWELERKMPSRNQHNRHPIDFHWNKSRSLNSNEESQHKTEWPTIWNRSVPSLCFKPDLCHQAG